MGLLERASTIAREAEEENEPLSPPSRNESPAAGGLLARASAMRSENGDRKAPLLAQDGELDKNVSRLSQGLLARAQKFRAENEAASPLPSPVPPPVAPEEKRSLEKGLGLLARAASFRETETPEAEPAFPEATEFESSFEEPTEFTSSFEEPSELESSFAEASTSAEEYADQEMPSLEEMMPPGDFAEAPERLEKEEEDILLPDTDSLAGEGEFDETPDFDSDLSLAEEQFLEEEKQLGIEPGAEDSFLAEPEEAVLGGTLSPEEEKAIDALEQKVAAKDPAGLPAWDYEGPSAPWDDPALGEEDIQLGDDDVFQEWEKEARQAGEQKAEQEVLANKAKRPEYLFDGEDYATRPVESHIASQKKIDNYLSIFDISRELQGVDDVASLWDSILYAVMGQVGAETVCIFSSQRARKGAVFYPVAHTGFDIGGNWVLKPGDIIYDAFLEAPDVRYARDFLEKEDSNLSLMEKAILKQSRAVLIAPMKYRGELYGLLMVGPQLKEESYNLDDIEFLLRLGETAAASVERVMSRVEFEQDTQELRLKNELNGKVFSFAREVTGVNNLDEFYDILGTHLREDFNIDSFSLVLLNPRSQEYRLFGGNRISPESMEKFRLSVSSELIGLVSNLIRVYELPDFRENREVLSNYVNDDIALMRHYWLVPLISLSWLVGFITIHSTSAPWSEYMRELVVSAAEVAAPVVANAVILGERESLFRDPFSPLEGRLKLEISRAGEFQAPVSLVEIRIKNLKRLVALNPQDRMAEFLAELSRALSGFLFESDFLARVSQGRFAMILPGRSRGEADIFIKKLKADFKRKRLLPESPVEPQFIFNVMTCPHDTEDPSQMLAMLD